MAIEHIATINERDIKIRKNFPPPVRKHRKKTNYTRKIKHKKRDFE